MSVRKVGEEFDGSDAEHDDEDEANQWRATLETQVGAEPTSCR